MAAGVGVLLVAGDIVAVQESSHQPYDTLIVN